MRASLFITCNSPCNGGLARTWSSSEHHSRHALLSWIIKNVLFIDLPTTCNKFLLHRWSSFRTRRLSCRQRAAAHSAIFLFNIIIISSSVTSNSLDSLFNRFRVRFRQSVKPNNQTLYRSHSVYIHYCARVSSALGTSTRKYIYYTVLLFFGYIHEHTSYRHKHAALNQPPSE